MSLRFLTAGESHGPGLTAILEGLPAGLPLDEDLLAADLLRRQQGYGAGPRMKLESDHARITGGVLEGKTTGAPLALWIENQDHARWLGKDVPGYTVPRPGHADLTGVVKYGLDDIRPALERASARETAARVAAGAACRALLAQFDIRVGGYVAAIGAVEADLSAIALEERAARALLNEVHCPDPQAAEAMQARIRQVMQERDTLGGVLEVIALGLPAGLGSYAQWDRRLDAQLAAALMSVQAIKGVEIGPAFANTRLPGTQVHDAIRAGAPGAFTRGGVNSGGLEGGVTTGQPLLLRAAMKPIATTLNPQRSVDLADGAEVDTRYERSDYCPVPRAVVILEAMTAFVLANALIEKLGGDSLDEMRPRYAALRRAGLPDAALTQRGHVFWPKAEAADGE
jgi:chorismate synthase